MTRGVHRVTANTKRGRQIMAATSSVPQHEGLSADQIAWNRALEAKKLAREGKTTGRPVPPHRPSQEYHFPGTLNCGVEQRVARRAHNPEVASSNLAPATTNPAAGRPPEPVVDPGRAEGEATILPAPVAREP